MRLVVAPEVLVQLAGAHQQEGALQGLGPGGGRSPGQRWPGCQGDVPGALDRAAWNWSVNSQPGVPLPSPRRALPEQLSLGAPGHASQQQFLLPVHEFVGETVAAPAQFLSHTGSLEGAEEGHHSGLWLWGTMSLGWSLQEPPSSVGLKGR